MAPGAQAFARRRALGLLIVVGVVVVRAAVGVRMDQLAVAGAVPAQVTISKLHTSKYRPFRDRRACSRPASS